MFTTAQLNSYYLPALVFIAAVAIMVLLIYAASTPKTNVKGRIKTIRLRREELSRAKILKSAGTEKKQKKTLFSTRFMKDVVKGTVKPDEEKITETAMKLSRAGIRDRDAVFRHFFYKVCWASALPFAMVILLYFVLGIEMDAIKIIGLLLGSLILGFLLPDLVLDHHVQTRLLPIRRSFPDALDMMVVCAESGLGIDAGLKRVAQEMGHACPPLAEELALTSVELSFFEDRSEALNNLAKRINIPSVKSFVNTMIQTEKFGTPVAQSLRVLSAEFRNERMMEAETKAAQLPAKMTMPLILCILPPLMIVLIAPAIIKAIDVFEESGVNK